MNSQTRLQKARIALLIDEPFFGSLLMHLKPIADPNQNTFGTDGRVLRYNPKFMEELSDPELKTILAHEVLHCALLHPFRLGNREWRRANIAADFAVNNFLDNYNQEANRRNGRPPFPFTGPLAGGCLDHKYDPYSFEEIYNLLPTKGGKGKGQPSDSDHQPSTKNHQQPFPGEFTAGGKDQSEADVAEAQWKVAMKQAVMAAKAQGKLPGCIARLVDELLEPKVHWREVLRTLLTSLAKNDYNWARPNTRYASSGFVLPSLHSMTLGRIAVAIDTSGSIGQPELNEFLSEVQSILFDCQPETLVLIQCDAAVQEWRELQTGDPLELTMQGGGGTDFRPVFDAFSPTYSPTHSPTHGDSEVSEQVSKCVSERDTTPPTALIYLTDLQGTFPETAPPYPVIWAATTDAAVPFGEVVRIS